MTGKLQSDLRRNFGARGFIKRAYRIAGLTAIATLALAAPAFAQASLDAYGAAGPSAPPADVASASATSPPAAGSADAGSDTFAPASGAAIVAPDSGYALPPPDGGSLADSSPAADSAGTPDSSSEPASVADGTPSDASPTDDASPSDASATSVPSIDLASPFGGIAPVAAADADSSSASGWDRVGDTDSDAGGSESGNSVLEVPRAVPSPDASAGNDNSQSAQGGDSAPPDQIGSVNEYQDETDNPMAIYISPATGPPLLNPPFVASTFGNQPSNNAPALPGVGPMLPSGARGVRPFAAGMNSAIMPTSPMYPRHMMVRSYRPTAPRSAAPIPGGWWNRAR